MLSEKNIQKTIKSLQNNGFKARLVDSRQELNALILENAKNAQNIGFGGSMTINELGLKNLLEKDNKNILDHTKPGLSESEKEKIRRGQLTCDLFLTSANAITQDGEIINADAIGNRVCSMIYGPKKIIIIAGLNKIVKNLREGIKRIKNIAAPLNAKRLNKNMPCVQTNICMDCNLAQRICRVTTILEKKPWYSDIEIIFLKENLGF